MDKKFSIRQFPSPEHPYIAFPQINPAVLNISTFTTGEIGPESRLVSCISDIFLANSCLVLSVWILLDVRVS